MPKRDGSESRKNNIDGIRLKPKCFPTESYLRFFFNGQSATKPRTEEGSTTIPLWK